MNNGFHVVGQQTYSFFILETGVAGKDGLKGECKRMDVGKCVNSKWTGKNKYLGIYLVSVEIGKSLCMMAIIAFSTFCI